ncbi:hypothetical protein C1645_310536 [Glomus cerebriforme]|uniref:Uncharacterized protein n=1 Tax=Glomus cerebriforme TaxID=658196 RepID=A0A397SSN9_9GLOM|nr:hypothetical protein C1645_310536 [Glomus cerebriforme]
MSLNNYTSKDDENFLKEFLKDFYRQVMKIEDKGNLKNILKEWLQNFLSQNKKEPKEVLNLMENHQENKTWFSSLIGFFYECGIGNNINKEKAFKFYRLLIHNQNDKLISMYQLLNIIISKYLLLFFYYEDIISSMSKISYSENEHAMSYDQFENFNGLVINMCKDEINVMENILIQALMKIN